MQVDDDDDEASGSTKTVQEERHNVRAVVTDKNYERATATQNEGSQDPFQVSEEGGGVEISEESNCTIDLLLDFRAASACLEKDPGFVSKTCEISKDRSHKKCTNTEQTAKEHDKLQSSIPLKRKKRCAQAVGQKRKRRNLPKVDDRGHDRKYSAEGKCDPRRSKKRNATVPLKRKQDPRNGLRVRCKRLSQKEAKERRALLESQRRKRAEVTNAFAITMALLKKKYEVQGDEEAAGECILDQWREENAQLTERRIQHESCAREKETQQWNKPNG